MEQRQKRAWLITNEFLNTNKYTEINQWLVAAGKRHGIDLFVRTNAEVMTELGFGTEKNEQIDFVLFWDKDIRLAAFLEKLGYRVYNSSKAIAACDDKSLTHLILQKQGIRMPRTILAPMTYANIGYTNLDFLTEVQQKLPFPMIVKECFGSFGMQVYKAENQSELEDIVHRIGAKPMLFQEFIKGSAGRDLRIHVVGDQVVTAMYRYSEDGDFRANITNGGKMKPYTPTAKECEVAIRCTKVLELDFAGVDLLFGDDGETIVCEVNSNAHFKNIYDCTGVNVADSIMEYILNDL